MNLSAVAIISTVDESVDSRYSRSWMYSKMELERRETADDEDQLQALKSEVNQLIQQEDFALFISADEATVSSRNAKISSRKMNSRRKQQQHPVESLLESAVANQPVASFAYSVDLVPRRKELKKEQSAAVVVINQQRSS
ncbi:putative receptor-like protein kinase [Dorcoceras hygrometricum]|uniref:Putative receptor-like protein kinase n=1 Tax=Dorcoceras hygrometricum TaxID=472368 RepID=A0A2Z7B7D6_9LAMI|nr:putative receptor-like protein kinase [Dorcoceras hygrometricum]